MMLWIPLDAQAFQGSVVMINLQLLAAEALRVLLQKLYHTHDACLENVVLIRICYVLFSPCLVNK